ncbi:MAG: YifB family Mg chelatase-like AAA ATPase [Candidatus Campbellbacteria bacterium]|nr:YifB family Mg chelatase-like AAA ATPase [Candidatus Campbellbacteria bacterium]
MGFAKLTSAQIDGLEPKLVSIEIDIARGLNSFTLVGLPDKAVEESHDRVSAAIKNSGFKSPKQKNENVVISLAPAELKKTGPVFDLGIAMAYLLASEEINFAPEKKMFLGELSLNGEIKPINGVLSIVQKAKEEGYLEIFVPKENAEEAALVENVDIYSPSTLNELITHLDPESALERDTKGKLFARSLSAQPKTKPKQLKDSDRNRVSLDDIKGQETAKRGLEIAAAGGHNVLLFGPPGTGKTLLAKAFSSLLSDLSFEEALEVTAIHSAVGKLDQPLLTRPPFRSPHHTSSYVSIVGGGANPRPGEITLAHRGVIFLDEFPQFDRRVIESLREPLEEKRLTVSRSQRSSSFPADFILIAAMNPCPCGNRGSEKDCRCTPSDLARYERKLSGPILDRIDLWIEVGKIEISKLRESTTKKEGDPFAEEEMTKKRIALASSLQSERFKKEEVKRNAQLGPRSITQKINAEDEVYTLIENVANELELSARGYHKVLKVARTIADLNESERVKEKHLLEALQYRQKPIFL